MNLMMCIFYNRNPKLMIETCRQYKIDFGDGIINFQV